ncbi:hypothetical protein F5148DRAFT_185718 [Russula earlei]|uniref:Uncharacterized protein n=1 Tax=Russula earlei TaxID=71964 RepID=A0ACC0U7M3_9AGAM|nr:hypothetical protein F5148DRAFT_185718 [Russula earlei]
MAVARRWHEQPTSWPCLWPHPPSPSTILRCLPQCSRLKSNATKLTTRPRLQQQEQQASCTTTTHDDSVEHAHVHALPLSTTGSSMLMPPSPASLPHAPAYNNLELSVIPLFVTSSFTSGKTSRASESNAKQPINWGLGQISVNNINNCQKSGK